MIMICDILLVFIIYRPNKYVCVYVSFYGNCSSNYLYSNSCYSFLLSKALAISFSLFFAKASKIEKQYLYKEQHLKESMKLYIKSILKMKQIC